jgi:phosphate transport system permease protein
MNARTTDRIAIAVIIGVACLIMAVLAALLGYLLFRGISHISWHFLTSAPETIKKGGGIGPQLFNSLFLLVLTMIITIPLGVGAGIYMSEYAKAGSLLKYCHPFLRSLLAYSDFSCSCSCLI